MHIWYRWLLSEEDHNLLIYLHETTQKPTVCLKTEPHLFVLLNLSPLSLSVFVSHRHTLPASQWEEATGRNPEWYRETLGDGRPVIIYLHGNVGTRWEESSRVETLELILMESSGYHNPWVYSQAQCTQGFVSLKATCLFVFIHILMSFL